MACAGVCDVRQGKELGRDAEIHMERELFEVIQQVHWTWKTS